MLIILRAELATESKQVFETIFPALIGLLGIIAGGILTFLATRYQTQKDIEKEDRKERKKVAAKISSSITQLQLTAVVNLTIPFVTDTNAADAKTSSAFTKSVLLRHELAYCLPEYAQKALQDFLDATELNIRCWRNKLKNEIDDTYKLSKDDYMRTPHLDQAQGEAYKALLNVYSTLKKYVNDKNA